MKARFDRGERDFRFLIPASTLLAVGTVLATLDPFGWFAGPPATGPARKEIRMACFIIVLWLLFAWFLLVRPLKTGNAVDYRKYGRTTAVLRSDEPSRFWFIYWWGALLLSGMLALGLYCLTDRLRELRKSRPPTKEGLQATGAARVRLGVHQGASEPRASA